MSQKVIALLVWAGIGTALVALALYFLVFRKDTRKAVADPPFRPLTSAEKTMAALINAHDHDMRSLELGRWYVRQLRALVKGTSCPTNANFGAIAGKVPNANAVTKKEVERLLRELQADVCRGAKDVGAALDEFERMALHPSTGVLAGMPGYAHTSPATLPP